MKKFSLKVLGADSEVFSGEVVSLAAKAVDGEIGILADHAPLSTVLSAGEVRFRASDGGPEKSLPAAGGLLIVKNNSATVLL